jgi:hypothetical protein
VRGRAGPAAGGDGRPLRRVTMVAIRALLSATLLMR